MPYKHSYDGSKIPQKLKKSAKLSDDDREEISKMYKLGGWSYATLAKEFGVSKRLIGFIIKPETQTANYNKRVENGGSAQYYDKEKNTEAMRKHRRFKQQLKLEGKLDDTTTN